MPWPLSQDYNEALQNPQTSFSDPELRQGQVAVNALGIPQPCSGNFADVYAVECPATRSKWAVKCFTREVHGLRERYSEISRYLQQVHLPFMVDFQYQEQGIRIAGRWYPILKMHWVEGLALNTFVRDMLDKPSMLEKLSRVWVRMARRLRGAGLAHCDLQHGNILLVPDSEASALAVKLIDYDGMWVPALALVPSGEVGHPAYQHPGRRSESVYNALVDRFPLLAVHVALRALIACGRSLWDRYDTGDNMLFRPADFETPAKSPLFAELLRLHQPDIRALVVQLIDAARLPLEQTPHLADLVADDKSITLAAPRTPAPVTARSKAVESVIVEPNPFADLEPEEARWKRRGSLLPWMAAGGVAACALIGGVLLWERQRGNTSGKPSTSSALVQAVQTPTQQTPEEAASPGPRDEPSPEKEDKINPKPHEPSTSSAPLSPVPQKNNTPPTAQTPKSSNPQPSPPKPKTEEKPAKPAEAPVSKTEPPRSDGKSPLPDESILKSLTEEIQDTFKSEYASRDRAELAALAEKLLKRGRKQFEPPERRFVFLREASTVAARAGNVELSVSTVEELGKLFAIEELPLKTVALQQAANNIRTIDTSKAILQAGRPLLAEAVRADDYENAERLLKIEEVAAFKADVPRSALQDTAGQIKRLKTKYAALKPALAKLAREATDPEANRLVGGFRCFEKGDWENGLPLLAHGDDAALKLLAEKDLTAPTSVDARVELGDAWWQLGNKSIGARKRDTLRRACHWYERAVPEAAEPTRTRLEKNIRLFNEAYPALAWGHLDTSQATLTLGVLALSNGDKGIPTLEAWSGPVEITSLARTEKNNIRFRMGKGGCVIFNWENKPDELRIARPDGTDRQESGSLATAPLKPLRPNTWYFLSWRITESGMSVSVNGRTIFSEEHKNDLSEKHPISIQSVDSDIEVLSFTVRPLGKRSTRND